MNNTDRLSLRLESFANVSSETNRNASSPSAKMPSLNSVLNEFAPLPRAALLLGLALDGLPILLNLLDPLPGPLMITGSEGSGKTNFLQTIARSVEQVHLLGDLSYSIITGNVSEWTNLPNTHNCESVLAAREGSAAKYLHAVVERAHSNDGGHQAMLIMIDRVELLIENPEVQQELKWLLLRGPARRVWPILTINSSIAVSDFFRPWLDSFRTRIFGFTRNDQETHYLTGSPKHSFTNLLPPFQFAMREGNDWLQFWIPTSD